MTSLFRRKKLALGRPIIGALLALAGIPPSLAQTPRDFALDLRATAATSSPCITLSWSQRQQGKIASQKIYRRLKSTDGAVWELQATLATNDTSYADASAVPGVEYEYWMQHALTISPSPAVGYLSAGVDVPMSESRGILLLVVDSTMALPLAEEIAQLQQDLAGDGWTVQTLSADRTHTAAAVKAQIQAAYLAQSNDVRMVYLLGHVPVPYSGNIAPDGHGDHIGAWPSDGYYGDMDGTWTDVSVNNTSASRAQNDNIPGDGKFDQSSLPSALELSVGRVDLHSMTRAPSSAATETQLLRRYLRRAHDYRHKQNAYAAIPRSALLRDGFGYFSGEAFAIAGWSWMFSGVGLSVDEPGSGQWFSSSYAGGKDYLVGYGNGGGSYESASSVGNTVDFGLRASRVVFTSLFGSYFGDWDSGNNFLRAPLAGNATGDSLGLTCFWGGRPNRFSHHLGMGETVGFAAKVSQNANFWGVNYQPNSYAGVHCGLMGDPALRLHAVAPPRHLAAASAGSQVVLKWSAPSETNVRGYQAYRAASRFGPFTRLTEELLTSTTFTDTNVVAGQTYAYLVRTLKAESAPGGSYFNLSVGAAAEVTARASPAALPYNASSVTATSSSSTQAVIQWSDNSTNETGFRIERKVNAAGSFSALGSVAAGVTSFTDTGPFSHGNVYYYRVVATHAAGDAQPSDTASFEAVAGHFDLPSTRIKVGKAAGSVSIAVSRFGGQNGAVSVAYATSDSSALAGIHYAATNGLLSWADGEAGTKTVTVPILNTPTPQPARQFKVTLSGNSAGTGLTVNNKCAVLIEDATATLSAPWGQAIIGSVTDSSAAALIDGVFSSVVIGGSAGSSGSTSDNGRFVYQSRTGDGVLTAFLPSGVPADGSARVALMVRASTANNAVMAAAVGSAAASYGAKLAYRASAGAGAAVSPSASNALLQPCWLRLTRAGNMISAEASSDGAAWSTLGTAQLPGLPATALWGLFHCSADWSVSSLGNYHLAFAQSLTLADLPLPAAPTGVVATATSPTSVALSWQSVPGAAGYRIERLTETNDFVEVANLAASAGTTQTYVDVNVSPDAAFGYRVIAFNGSGTSPASAVAYVSTPLPEVVVSIGTSAQGADATVQRDQPATALGTGTVVTVAGYYFADGTSWSPLTNAAKTYLKFDLAGLSQPSSARLHLTFVDARLFELYGYYNLYVAMLADASDAWDENTITWSNAPQNNTSSYWFTGAVSSVGSAYAESLPASGETVTLDLDAQTLFGNRGPDNLVTLALAQYYGASMDWASREQGVFAPPTLEFSSANPVPSHPAFLTASQDWLWAVRLDWRNSSPGVTEFQIERSQDGGAFEPLQTLDGQAASFVDRTTRPDVQYAYRVRAVSAAGASAWSRVVSITTPEFFKASGTLWDAGGVTPLVNNPTNWDRDVNPPFDGSVYLNFAAAGDRVTVNTNIGVSGLSMHQEGGFTLDAGGGAISLGAGGLRAANPNSLSSCTYAVECALFLTSNQTWGVTNNGAGKTELTVTGPIADQAGSFGLTKSGNGILTLAGDNAYGGATSVSSGGVLRVCHDRALGSTNGNTTVNNGGWLELTGNVSVAEALVLNGDAAVGYAGTLRSTGGTNAVCGAVSQGLRSRVTVLSGGCLALTGGVSGPGIYLSPESNACLSVSGRPLTVGASTVYAHGKGTVALGASSNTWGTLEIGDATVRTDAPNAFPPGSILAMGASGALDATLDLNGNDQTVAQLKRGLTTAGNRLVTSSKPARLTVNQTGSTYYYDGNIGGEVSLVKSGAGTWVLLGTGNTYAGDTTVSNGVLTVAANVRLGNSTNVTVAGGQLKLQAVDSLSDAATLRIETGAKVYLNPGLVETVAALVLDGGRKWQGTWGATGSGAVNIDNDHFAGTGMVLVPTGSSTAWDGGATTTDIDAPFNWDYDNLPLLDGSAVLAFGVAGHVATVNTNVSLRGLVLNREADFEIAPGPGVLSLGESGLYAALPGTSSYVYTVGASLAFTTNQIWCVTNTGPQRTSVTVTGTLSDGDTVFGLTKSGDGLLTLAGDNTYEGETTVLTGSVLRVAHARGLGSLVGVTRVHNGGTLELSGNITVDETVVLNGDAAGTDGALCSVEGTNTWRGTLSQSSRSRVGATGGSMLALSCAVTGPGLYVSPGAGSSVALLGQPLNLGANTLYAHGLGTLVVGVSGNVWSTLEVAGLTVRTDLPNVLPASAALALGSSAHLDAFVDLNGNDQTVGQLKRGITTSGNRLVTSLKPATLTVNQTSSTYYYDGNLGGALSLVKSGGGTLVLLGTGNTYTGVTVVNAGTLTVNAGCRLGHSTRTVVNGGTLKLMTETALSDESELAIADGGAKVNVGAGITETVKTLRLGGKLMRRGTYGASSSDAFNLDDAHFSGTGKVLVLQGTETFLFIR